MTHIHVTSNYISKERKQLIEKFATFVSRELRIHNHPTAIIHIGVHKAMPNDDAGDCYDWYWKSKKVIKIRIRPFRDIQRIFEVIAHELVHARQYMSGKLKSGHANSSLYWKGKSFEEILMKCKREEYAPFEMEAYCKEDILVSKWKRARKGMKKPWDSV